MTSPLRVMGIDPSLSVTALVEILADRQEDPLRGASRYQRAERLSPKRLSGPERMDWLREQIITHVDTFAPDLIVIEGFALGVGRGASMQHEVSGWGWIARWTIWTLGYPMLEVPPATLKKFVTGKGNAPKEIIIREVHRRWAYEAVDNNDSDAYSLARLGWAHEAVVHGYEATKALTETLNACRVIPAKPPR